MFATLFGRRQRTEIQPKKLERPQPQKLIVADGTREALAEYEMLATQLGFKPAEVRQEELKLFLADNAIPTYDGMQVHRYLVEQASAQDKCYGWIPLRTQDKRHSCEPLLRERTFSGFLDSEGTLHGGFWNHLGPYTAIVPLSVMRTVAKIHESFPDAHFFVSEISNEIEKDPDPLLSVAIDACHLLVVDFWNEPGFRPA